MGHKHQKGPAERNAANKYIFPFPTLGECPTIYSTYDTWGQYAPMGDGMRANMLEHWEWNAEWETHMFGAIQVRVVALQGRDHLRIKINYLQQWIGTP